MIGYKSKAIKEVSRTEINGYVTVKEKIQIQVNYLGDIITLIGWNGQTRTRTYLSKEAKKLNRSWAYIDNKTKGNGFSNPTRDTKPTLETTSN